MDEVAASKHGQGQWELRVCLLGTSFLHMKAHRGGINIIITVLPLPSGSWLKVHILFMITSNYLLYCRFLWPIGRRVIIINPSLSEGLQTWGVHPNSFVQKKCGAELCRIVHQWPESFSFKILNLTSKFHQINVILHNAVSCMLVLRRQKQIYKSFARRWETMSRLFSGRNALLPAKTVVGRFTVHGPWSTLRPRSMVRGPKYRQKALLL